MKKDGVDEVFSKNNIGSHLEIIGWLIPISAAIIIGFYAYTFSNLPMNEDPSRWGTFGDFVGGLLNPLISTCTFIVAVRVFQLQKIETEMTRNELEETRQAIQDQTRSAEQQRSQQRFFDLLRFYQDVVMNFSIDGIQGKPAFKIWRKNKELFAFSITISSIINDSEKYSGFNPYSSFNSAMGAWSKDRNLFLQYFSIIQAIFSELENLTGEDHKRYGNLFRSQLSEDEVFLLAFEALLADSDNRMEIIIEKYGLLKFLPGGPLRGYAKNKLTPQCFED